MFNEIPKFRAWLIIENFMIENVGLLPDGRVILVPNEEFDSEQYAPHLFNLSDLIGIYEKSEVILMQSIGLTDKNGTLVFEGDIVRITFGDQRTKHDVFTHIATVERVNLDWVAVRANTPHRHSRLNAYHNASFEVLGSVHANKELLNDNG